MKAFIIIAALLLASDGFACDLSLVAPAQSALKNPVRAGVSLVDGALIARFSVSSPSLNAKKAFGPQQYPYNFDVVELFVTFSDTGFPYYEFEVSPFNQTFQVRIDRTRHQEGVDLGLMSTATVLPTGWTAQLKVPLKSLGWKGDPATIRGNLYAILERAPKRSFWSMFLPKAARANFHQPEFFQPLLSSCE
jgi:hypothetical protein